MKYSALVVDDDPTMLRLLELYLSKNEINVLSTTNAQQALEYLNREIPDIIVSDILMPDMDGLEFRKTILKNDRLRLIPFIFITARGMLEERLEGYSLYVDDYITKPFEPREMLMRINAVLKRYSFYQDILKYDALTMTLNRRTSEDLLNKEFLRSKRYDVPLTIALLDIDHFKQCNDTYGHVFGDYVLVKVADVFLSQIRETDSVGRYGGEEFLVILPDTDIDYAFTVIERIRQQVECLQLEQFDYTVTVSAGIARCQSGLNHIRDLIHQADTALYKAKNTGRNKVEIAEYRAQTV